MRAYGDVPLVTTTLTNAQANSVERTPAAEVFKFIVDECDAVAQYLPVTYNDIPRPGDRPRHPWRRTGSQGPHSALLGIAPLQQGE